MPATDDELLMAQIEAQLRQFEAMLLLQATASVDRERKRIETRFRAMERTLGTISSGQR